MGGEEAAGLVLAPAGGGQVGLGAGHGGLGGGQVLLRPPVLLVGGDDGPGLLLELGDDRRRLGPLVLDLARAGRRHRRQSGRGGPGRRRRSSSEVVRASASLAGLAGPAGASAARLGALTLPARPSPRPPAPGWAAVHLVFTCCPCPYDWRRYVPPMRSRLAAVLVLVAGRGHRLRHRRQQLPPLTAGRRPSAPGGGRRRPRPRCRGPAPRSPPRSSRSGSSSTAPWLPGSRSTTSPSARAPASSSSTSKTVDFAGSDVPLKPSEVEATGGAGAVVQVPWTAGGVAVEYNLPGVDGAAPHAAGVGRHLRRSHHQVERSGHQGREPQGVAARIGHPGGAPLRRVGHHPGLHRLPEGGGARRVDVPLGQGLAGGHARHRRQGLRRRDRRRQAVGRVRSATPSPAIPSRPGWASPPSATRPAASSPLRPTR